MNSKKIAGRSVRLFLIWLLIVSISSCKSQYTLQQIEANSISVNEHVAEDSRINELIQPYKDSLSLTMNQVIGYSAIEMSKDFPEGLLGNFVTDLMFEMTTNQLHKQVDFAFTNNGGLRTILPKGDISLSKIYELMPFENEIIVLEMDYETLTKLFDYIASGGELAVSGLMLTIKNDTIFEATIGGKEIDKQKIYKVATIDYLANGGSGMSFLEDISYRDLVGVRLRDMIIDFIKLEQVAGNELSAELQGRIRIDE